MIPQIREQLAGAEQVIDSELTERSDMALKGTILYGEPEGGVQFRVVVPSESAGADEWDTDKLEDALTRMVADGHLTDEGAATVIAHSVTVEYTATTRPKRSRSRRAGGRPARDESGAETEVREGGDEQPPQAVDRRGVRRRRAQEPAAGSAPGENRADRAESGVSGFDEAQREALHDDAMAAAKRCIRLVVEGDPESPSGGAIPSADRKANAQAALALVQTARTLEDGPRR